MNTCRFMGSLAVRWLVVLVAPMAVTPAAMGGEVQKCNTSTSPPDRKSVV